MCCVVHSSNYERHRQQARRRVEFLHGRLARGEDVAGTLGCARRSHQQLAHVTSSEEFNAMWFQLVHGSNVHWLAQVLVVGLSVTFILFVTILHIFGKVSAAFRLLATCQHAQ